MIYIQIPEEHDAIGYHYERRVELLQELQAAAKKKSSSKGYPNHRAGHLHALNHKKAQKAQNYFLVGFLSS